MGLVRERVDARGVDPPVVEIKQSANGDGVIDRLVIPAGGVKRLHIVGGNLRRAAVHLIDEVQQRFLFFAEARGSKIAKDRLYKFLAIIRAAFPFQKYRRDRGVRLQSERAIIAS